MCVGKNTIKTHYLFDNILTWKLLLKQFRSLAENHFEIEVKKFSVSEVDPSPFQLKSVKEGLQEKILLLIMCLANLMFGKRKNSCETPRLLL